MKKTITVLTAITVLGLAGPASAGKSVTYTGKTSSGHKVAFQIKNKRIQDLTAGIRMSCIPIQGGGRPIGGSEVFGFRGSLRIKRDLRYTFMEKPAFHFNEVTMTNDLWLKRRGKRTITGRMRLQYSFLVPKYRSARSRSTAASAGVPSRRRRGRKASAFEH